MLRHDWESDGWTHSSRTPFLSEQRSREPPGPLALLRLLVALHDGLRRLHELLYLLHRLPSTSDSSRAATLSSLSFVASATCSSSFPCLSRCSALNSGASSSTARRQFFSTRVRSK